MGRYLIALLSRKTRPHEAGREVHVGEQPGKNTALHTWGTTYFNSMPAGVVGVGYRDFDRRCLKRRYPPTWQGPPTDYCLALDGFQKNKLAVAQIQEEPFSVHYSSTMRQVTVHAFDRDPCHGRG